MEETKVTIEKVSNGFVVRCGDKVWVEKGIHYIVAILKEAFEEQPKNNQKTTKTSLSK